MTKQYDTTRTQQCRVPGIPRTAKIEYSRSPGLVGTFLGDYQRFVIVSRKINPPCWLGDHQSVAYTLEYEYGVHCLLSIV